MSCSMFKLQLTRWESVKQSTLVKSWRKILPNVENTLVESAEEEEVSACDLANLAKSVTGGGNVDEDNIVEWINCDANDPGFEHLTDEQIVGGALGMVLEESEEEEEDKMQKKVSHDAALAHIDGLIQYLEEPDDASLCDKMLLQKLQSQIKKRCLDYSSLLSQH